MKLELLTPGFQSLHSKLVNAELELKSFGARYCENWHQMAQRLTNEWGDNPEQWFLDELTFIRRYRNDIQHKDETVLLWSVKQTTEMIHNLMKALWDFKSERYVLSMFHSS